MENNPEDNLITIFTHKEITNLFKRFLEILEDIKSNQDAMIKKGSANVDSSYLNDINYFTPEFYEQCRKRILDSGNSTERNLLGFLEYFNFQINPEKLKEAASKTKIIKRISVNSPILKYNN